MSDRTTLNDEERAVLAKVESEMPLIDDGIREAWRFSYPFAAEDVQRARLAHGLTVALMLGDFWKRDAPKQRARTTTAQTLSWTQIDSLLYLLRVATLVALDAPPDESVSNEA